MNQSERAEPARNAGQDTNGALSGIEQAGEKLGKALEQVAPQIDNAGQEINRALRALERLGPIDAQTKLEVEQAIEGDIHAAVTTAVAGYKVQTSAMWIALATFALAALLLAPMMVTRKRAAETRAALARAEAEQARLQQEMTEARLAAMQAQIEPHFLFNTMASVQHLIETNPGRAAHLQQNLTQYLRAAIPQLRESTTVLGREVELARAYLSVLKARMEERLEFRIDVPTLLASGPFPPMMLLTLVENAIKHGLEAKPEGGAVRISATREGEAMQVTVADTGAGFEPKPGFGMGLTNIRERLRLLYGDKASLTLEPNEPAGTRAILALPYS